MIFARAFFKFFHFLSCFLEIFSCVWQKTKAFSGEKAFGRSLYSFLYACFGRCEGVGEKNAEDSDHALRDGTHEKQNLRAGEGVSENGKDVISHITREERAEHHTEEGCHIGNDGVEREVIRSVFVGKVDVRERGHDRTRCDAEDMLREADDDVQPDRIRCYERIRVIRQGVNDQDNGERAEPIEFGDQPFPHIREEDEKQEIRCVDTVTKRIADADVFQNISVERCIGQVQREGVRCGDQDRAEKAFIFERERKDIGELCARGFCIGEFFGNQPDHAVDDGERKRDITNGDQHRSFLGGILQCVADCGNDEREDIGKRAVDTACGVKVVYADVIGQEVRVPRGEAGREELVDRACEDDQDDKPNEHLIEIGNECRQERDADDIDEIVEQLARNEYPLSLAEAFEDQRRKDVEQTCDVGDEGQDTDTGFVQTVHQEEAGIEQASRKLTDKS